MLKSPPPDPARHQNSALAHTIHPLSREVIFSAQTRRGELALGGSERIVPLKDAPAFEQQLKAHAELVVWP
jgi:hypothetical protein